MMEEYAPDPYTLSFAGVTWVMESSVVHMGDGAQVFDGRGVLDVGDGWRFPEAMLARAYRCEVRYGGRVVGVVEPCHALSVSRVSLLPGGSRVSVRLTGTFRRAGGGP